MYRYLLAVGIFLVASAQAADQSKAFNAWLDASWEETLVRDPILATIVGDPRYNDRVVNTTTAEWRADNRRYLEQQLLELKRFDPARLTAAERVSYGVRLQQLESALESERFPNWMQPVNAWFSKPQGVGYFGSGNSAQPFRTVKDYDDWHARLSATVPMFDGWIANMRIGMVNGVTQPRPLMEKLLPQLQALAVANAETSVFWGPVRTMTDAIPPGEQARISSSYRALIQEQVAPAYQRLHDFIRDEYIPKARTTTAWSDLPDGRAWYAYLVKQSTTTSLTPEQIHALGEREVAQTLKQMDQVRQQLGFRGDRSAFFAHMRDDPKFYFNKPDEVLAAFNEIQKRVDPQLPRLFNAAPRADYVVQPVEKFQASSAPAAMYMNGSADGTRPGRLYLNVFNLKALPKYGTETLSLHEASPGHHFQGSIAQESESLPRFRRYGTNYVAYAEGWALYAESLGKALDMYQDPYQWYGHLNASQIRSMRLVVDTGLHQRGWSRQRAIDYMRKNSAMAEEAVVVEVDRYISNPAQALGYRVGQVEISRMRREAEAVLGKKFDVKEFHRVVLMNGELPLSVLNEQVKRWVAEVAAASQ